MKNRKFLRSSDDDTANDIREKQADENTEESSDASSESEESNDLIVEKPENEDDDIPEGPNTARIKEVYKTREDTPGLPPRINFKLRLKTGEEFIQGYNFDMSTDSLFVKVLHILFGKQHQKINLQSLVGTKWHVIMKRYKGILNAWFQKKIEKKVADAA
ncbi:MAG: hypothetical protein HQM09_19345 [Candidatus Riflebacteria bacterium]|nr:hypothetical protein [Candidatus Riflebacteria bacterium]